MNFTRGLLPDGRLLYYRAMDSGASDATWEFVVATILEAGPAQENRSRYGDKPALFLNGREIAHREGFGQVDLRITRDEWSRFAKTYGGDPAVRRDPRRRDWIELDLSSTDDVQRLRPLLVAAVSANRR